MLSSQEQGAWDDVHGFWVPEAEEPPRFSSSGFSRGGVWHDQGELPVVLAAGVWLAVAVVLFGAVLAGLAIAAATAVGWALWRNWARLVRVVAARAVPRDAEVGGRDGRSSGSGPAGRPVDGRRR